MGARDLLQSLADCGFQVIAERGFLLVRPIDALPNDLRCQISEHRSELLSIAPRRYWIVSIEGRESFGVACPQGATREEVLARWPGARIEAQPQRG